MTVQEIAKEHIIENIVGNIGKYEDKDDLNDLSQDLYIELIAKENKIIEMNYKELKYYITRIVLNNIHSKNSRYYYTYKKHKNDYYDKNKKVTDEQ